jgi:putative endonuclease
MGDQEKPELNMPCFVYILGSDSVNGLRTYVGWTTNLERRLDEHNAGNGARSTRGREWRLLYSERAEDRSSAQSREWRLKQDRAFRKSLAKHITGSV